MADQDNVFGDKVVTPKGIFFFFDVDTVNSQEKHPKNKYPSDKFDVTLGLEQTADLSKLKSECDKVANQAFKTTEGVDMPFANGDEKSLSSMKGYIIIRAKCAKRPGLVDGSKTRITEGEMQPGMWGRISVTPMSYKSGKSKGVSLVLKNVQALTDLEYSNLGGGSSAEDDFGDDDF
jgi:hypothetical protein